MTERELKCPACRKRFSLQSEAAECARCGADLSLLIKLRTQADHLIGRALSSSSLNPVQRADELEKALWICRSSEVQMMIESLVEKKDEFFGHL